MDTWDQHLAKSVGPLGSEVHFSGHSDCPFRMSIGNRDGPTFQSFNKKQSQIGDLPGLQTPWKVRRPGLRKRVSRSCTSVSIAGSSRAQWMMMVRLVAGQLKKWTSWPLGKTTFLYQEEVSSARKGPPPPTTAMTPQGRIVANGQRTRRTEAHHDSLGSKCPMPTRFECPMPPDMDLVDPLGLDLMNHLAWTLGLNMGGSVEMQFKRLHQKYVTTCSPLVFLSIRSSKRQNKDVGQGTRAWSRNFLGVPSHCQFQAELVCRSPIRSN